jgi:hypothetical protein
VAIAEALQLARDFLNDGTLGRQQRLGVVKPHEGADFFGEAGRVERGVHREVPLFPGLAQFFQAGGEVAGVVLLHGGGQERLDLFAEGMVFRRGKSVPKPLPAQGDLDCLPGFLIRLDEDP